LLDQIAIVVLRIAAWLTLIGSVLWAALLILPIAAAGSLSTAAPPPSYLVPLQGVTVLMGLAGFCGGLFSWAVLNVIAAIAANLIALRESNDNLVRLTRYRLSTTTDKLSQGPLPAFASEVAPRSWL
jgi:hypothetical protein